MIGALIAITVCLGMAIVILHDIPSVPKSSPPQMHFSCGSTAVGARTAGCQFDLTTFTWAGQFPVNETFARTGDFDQLYTTMRYHVVHCAYAWRKLHRSLFGGDLSGIDGYIASIHHTEHCLGMMLEHGDWDRLPGVGVTKFASCGQGVLKEKSQHGWFRMMDGEKVYTLPTHV
ncbi:hypothetical protein AARAC_009595 [Aspergillus arachidicola]|uniref:Uncharacterized protein n=1 Tax=Aspergillus arachidicola TaxID=656916 RepID=A0A2G7ELA3_9EURO|nr:hypothetical protein AARAC_009595 [Aspergillus arachidicola]